MLATILAGLVAAGAAPLAASAAACGAELSPALLDGARVERRDDGTLQVRVPVSGPVADADFDALLASLLPRLGLVGVDLQVVDENGVNLAPPGLAIEALRRLGEEWRANHGGARLSSDSAAAGALRGVRIALSAGHGVDYQAGAWTFQRTLQHDLREDVHTNEIVFRHLAPMLEAAGADVVLVRERSVYPERVVVDNDDGGLAAPYGEIGAWQTGDSPGRGGTYRYAVSAPAATSTATWKLTVSRTDDLPVYAWFLAGANRSAAAQYLVDHAGGVSTLWVDQRSDSSRWRYLGTFPFAAGAPAAVHLLAAGDAGGVVVADAVRLGGGAGFADFGGGVSQHDRWEQGAAAYALEEEVPAPTRAGTNDVTVRPATALWQGASLFVSVHTNAGGGGGTSSFVYSGAVAYPDFDPNRQGRVPPGTLELQETLHQSLVETLRAEWDPAWADRGMYGADFGELRPIAAAWQASADVVVPAVLLEVAFHDDAADSAALREDRFRAVAARAIYRGIVHYVHRDDPGRAVVAPRPPSHLRALLSGPGLALEWAAAVDPVEATAGSESYVVEQSADGRVFVTIASTAGTRLEVGALSTCDTVAFRVIARNAGGTSLPSRPVLVRVNDRGPRVLWVDGERRLNRTALERPDGPHTAARVMSDLRAAAGGALRVDSARAEAVADGSVALRDYAAVVWTTGETSTLDHSLTAEEQAAITGYLGGGGALAISGAELGWDLVANGGAADRAFYRDTLCATYVSDDAGTFRVRAADQAAWLSGFVGATFDDGTGHSYRVDYADVIAPGSGAVAELLYDSGGVAAIRAAGAGRLFYAGFPLETIEADGARAELMRAILAGLLGAAPESPECGLPYGGLAADGGAGDGGGGGGDSDAAAPGSGCDCRSVPLSWPAGAALLPVLAARRRRPSFRAAQV